MPACLHCTALLGIVPVAVGLYSSRNKHTALLHYLTEDTGTYICKLPPTNNGKFTAFVHSHLVIRKVHILCFVIISSEKLLHSEEEVGDLECTWSISVDRQAHSGCSICFLLLKVEISRVTGVGFDYLPSRSLACLLPIIRKDRKEWEGQVNSPPQWKRVRLGKVVSEDTSPHAHIHLSYCDATMSRYHYSLTVDFSPPLLHTGLFTYTRLHLSKRGR